MRTWEIALSFEIIYYNSIICARLTSRQPSVAVIDMASVSVAFVVIAVAFYSIAA